MNQSDSPRSVRLPVWSLCVGAALGWTAQPGHGMPCDPLTVCRVSLTVAIGPVENTGSEVAVIHRTTVTVPQASSLSLRFSIIELPGDGEAASFVRLTSLLDGDSVDLDRESSWFQSGNRTPWFNGDGVLVELVASPGTGMNRLVTDYAWATIPISGDPDWLCFETDRFVRGDSNDDGSLNLTDAVVILERLFSFSPGQCFRCQDASDANDDGTVDVSDAITVLGHLFLGASVAIPGPFPACGADGTPDGLGPCMYMRNCE